MIKSLWLASCVHIGEKNHDKEELERYINWAKKNKNSVEIAFLGDLFDTGVPVVTRHIGSVFNNNMTPQEQLEIFIEKFKPLAPQIVAMLFGNHEKRIMDTTSIDTVKLAAAQLNVPYKGPGGVLVWNGQRIFIAHGTSTSMSDYNKIIASWEGLNVIALGHTHTMHSDRLRRFVVNAAGQISEKEIHLIRVGSFLKGAEYARFALHAPTPIGSAILEYDTETKKLNVRLGL